jgi:hypothetical protein
MSRCLTFQDGRSASPLPQQKPQSFSQETFPDQRSTQNLNQGQDRNQDSEDREARAHPNSSPGSSNGQQHSPPDSESMSTSDLNLNLPHIRDGCLTIEFMIGTPEGQMPDIENLGNEVSQPDLSFWCGLNHFNLGNKGLQSLLRHRSDCKCILVDPIGNLDLHSSMMGIARPRIDGDFGHRARKDTGIVSKCDFHDTRRGLNRAVTKRVCAVCVTLIKFHKFPSAGEHFNFLGTCVGSSENSIPNEVISLLKAITREIREALKGTLSAVLFLENECSTNDSLTGHLEVAR